MTWYCVEKRQIIKKGSVTENDDLGKNKIYF